MPIRDITVTAFVMIMLPFVLSRPHWGVLLWTSIGLMNPHKLGWSFAANLPFGVLSGAATLIALAISKEPKRLPSAPAVVTFIMLMLWMVVTTILSMETREAVMQWQKVATIQAFIIVTLIIMQSRERIQALMLVSALSIAFFGVKGGIYTIQTNGQGMVLGPPGGFHQGNTEISLAITMSVPLLWWMHMHSTRTWQKVALKISIALCAVAVLGSYSRGGLLAILGMATFLWLKSRQKAAITMLAVILIPVLLSTMPDRWFEKMNTIQTYQQDTSAMGRINAWHFAVNLANAHPFTGGGFEVFTPQNFRTYAPNPTDFHDAHSIWFEMLAEHGYVGLLLFIFFWIFTWRTGTRIIRDTKGRENLVWARDLAAMVQTSLVGFFVGGTFLGLAYWDFPYVLMCLLVGTEIVVRKEIAATKTVATPPLAMPAPLLDPALPAPKPQPQ